MARSTCRPGPRRDLSNWKVPYNLRRRIGCVLPGLQAPAEQNVYQNVAFRHSRPSQSTFGSSAGRSRGESTWSGWEGSNEPDARRAFPGATAAGRDGFVLCVVNSADVSCSPTSRRGTATRRPRRIISCLDRIKQKQGRPSDGHALRGHLRLDPSGHELEYGKVVRTIARGVRARHTDLHRRARAAAPPSRCRAAPTLPTELRITSMAFTLRLAGDLIGLLRNLNHDDGRHQLLWPSAFPFSARACCSVKQVDRTKPTVRARSSIDLPVHQDDPAPQSSGNGPPKTGRRAGQLQHRLKPFDSAGGYRLST